MIKLQGNISIHIPKDLSLKDCKVIGFIKDKTNLKIAGAAETSIR